MTGSFFFPNSFKTPPFLFHANGLVKLLIAVFNRKPGNTQMSSRPQIAELLTTLRHLPVKCGGEIAGIGVLKYVTNRNFPVRPGAFFLSRLPLSAGGVL
jgi:hypothetical protein